MLTKDIYGKTLSSAFVSKTTAVAQRIKPKVLIDWLDSRHCQNVVATTNAPHVSSAIGDLGYFFTPNQVVNGWTRQSFTWAIADDLDINGKPICADGTRYAMPSDLTDNFEYGWMSGTSSLTSLQGTYPGYGFTTSPFVQVSFTTRVANQIRVYTSEFNGQIDTYRLTVTGPSGTVYDLIARIKDSEYYTDHFLPSSAMTSGISTVKIEVLTTKNPSDNARVQEIDILYRDDISDYTMAYSYTKSRDVHVSSLPIAGTDSTSLSIDLDNTSKAFNILDNASTYGKYMRKDLRMFVSSGWQIEKYKDVYVQKTLDAQITSGSTTITLNNVDFLPSGSGNPFILEVDYNTQNKEIILCTRTGNTITISSRGYANTIALNHSAGALVRFETFEYPTYTETFVDEWAASSGSMSISVSTNDWTKYLNETQVTKGFFIEKATISQACENLLMVANFPKKAIVSLDRWDVGPSKNSGVLHLDFNESNVDRAGAQVVATTGLRARIFDMPASLEGKARDITADGLDRELTQLEKALGEVSFIGPDINTNASTISANVNAALDLVDYSFTNFSGEVTSTYYNAVFDGFYVPTASGNQSLAIDIINGGARVYIDNTLILNEWKRHPVTFPTYYRIVSETLNLTAGKPYQIRIETFNETGPLYIRLLSAVGAGVYSIVPRSSMQTVVGIDRLGSKNSSFAAGAADRNKQKNYAVYMGNTSIGNPGGLVSSEDNYSVLFGGTKYGRLPYDSSIDLVNTSSRNYNAGKWSVEAVIKPVNTFTTTGEYFSNWSNATPVTGLELYSNAASNGVRLVTSGGTATASTTIALSTTNWNHVFVTCNGTNMYYYVNGVERGNVALSGTAVAWSNRDFTFAGRNASFTTSEVAPTTIRDISFDELVMYNNYFDSSFIKNRYSEMVIQPMTIYPFLFGNEASVREIIDEITLADLGRFYIDEENIARYEHYFRFFEPSIDQHANVQITIDDNLIVNADYNVQLQANKVVVKIAGISSNLTGIQPLWRAEDPTTLAVVSLLSNISSSSTDINVSSTLYPPFSKAGYLVIDDEVIKYSNKTPTSFLNLERGHFGTTAASHTANSSVREARYWEVKYDKAPAFSVKKPFITGIEFENPSELNILKFTAGSYGANLLIAASNTVSPGEIVFAEGTNPLTGKVAYTAIAGIPVVISEQSSQINEQVAELTDSIRLYGLKEIVIESKFITDFSHAQKIANFIIDKMSTPVPLLNVNTLPTPMAGVGDRVRISLMDSFGIANGDYWLLSKTYNFGGSPSQVVLLRKVV